MAAEASIQDVDEVLDSRLAGMTITEVKGGYGALA